MGEDFNQMHDDARQDGDSYDISLWYPRQREIQNLRVSLMDVRAADDIRISYDFGRNGWMIEQASVFEWASNDTVCDPAWTESAFLPAWQYEKEA